MSQEGLRPASVTRLPDVFGMLWVVVNLLRAPFEVVDDELLCRLAGLHRREAHITNHIWRHALTNHYTTR